MLYLQQTKQHNPGTAIYLWHVDQKRLTHTIVQNLCRALVNLRMRRQHEMLLGKDWIERAKEAGDIEEALNAATAIGDDRLQKQSSGRVVPDSFTHGSSKQRVKWFMTGFENGDVRKCDTFSTNNL